MSINKNIFLPVTLMVFLLPSACQYIEVDPKELDLEEPYIPRIFPDAGVAIEEEAAQINTPGMPSTPPSLSEDGGFFREVEAEIKAGKQRVAIGKLLKFLETAKTRSRARARAYFLLARAHADLGHKKDAISVIKEALKENPQNPWAIEELRLLTDMRPGQR